jgi:class 3 adenylate cyclase
MIHRNNKRREEAGKIAWRIRIGLNTGKVMVKDGDVYGDAVNVAARVESSSEADHVFCTQETKEAVVNKKIQFEAKDLKKVKGKAEAIQLYSVVFDPAGK